MSFNQQSALLGLRDGIPTEQTAASYYKPMEDTKSLLGVTLYTLPEVSYVGLFAATASQACEPAPCSDITSSAPALVSLMMDLQEDDVIQPMLFFPSQRLRR
jgi:hypothetical protein